MDRLRPRNRPLFSGFTNGEIEKMERLARELRERSLDREFCHKLAINLNRSTGRAGKPAVKSTEIQNWFQTRLPELPSEAPKNESVSPKDPECKEGEIIRDSSEMEFEAKSLKDGAWYDVEMFLAHRFVSSNGEASLLDLLGLELRKMSGST